MVLRVLLVLLIVLALLPSPVQADSACGDYTVTVSWTNEKGPLYLAAFKLYGQGGQVKRWFKPFKKGSDINVRVCFMDNYIYSAKLN